MLERKGILKIHLASVIFFRFFYFFLQKNSEIDEKTINFFAKKSENFSGADIENIANESAYYAISEKREKINDQDLVKALEKILNEKKNLNLTDYV